MKVLAIGNSFAEDSFAWLADIARAAGVEMTLGDLYIGGCSLERHDLNIREKRRDYTFYKTGCEPRPISIEEALLDEEWDVVAMHQVSQLSGFYESYQPYLTRISSYVRSIRPNAKQVLHETWPYEVDSTHPNFPDYHCDQNTMYRMLRAAYYRAADDMGLPLIPSGDAMQIARKHPLFNYANGGKSLSRDGFHASLTCGRYLIGCVWFEMLTEKSCIGNSFVPHHPDEPEVTQEEIAVLQTAAHEAVALRRKTPVIKVKYRADNLPRMEQISVGDWIDLRAAEDVTLKAGEFKIISLGVSMKLPDGYEAHLVPRSSTFRKWGVIQANSMGIIDQSYAGENDVWGFSALAMRDTEIKKGDRICQFRIFPVMGKVELIEVDHMEDADRGGFGSTGTR